MAKLYKWKTDLWLSELGGAEGGGGCEYTRVTGGSL